MPHIPHLIPVLALFATALLIFAAVEGAVRDCVAGTLFALALAAAVLFTLCL
jgi:hypothetical protein